MHVTKKVGLGIAAAGSLFWGLTVAAFADGDYGTAKDAAAADEGRKFTWSITMAATSDYIFRGISTNDENPAFQPSINVGYGIWYGGAWGSNITGDYGPWETDWYTGIKPVWAGHFRLRRRLLHLLRRDTDLDYYELKAGASFSPFTNFTLTPVFWWTPSQSNLETWTIEGTAAYALPACGIFTPTISALVGYSDDTEATAIFLGDNNYTYWNAGLALAVEKFTFDFRYWDTDHRQWSGRRALRVQRQRDAALTHTEI